MTFKKRYYNKRKTIESLNKQNNALYRLFTLFDTIYLIVFKV